MQAIWAKIQAWFVSQGGWAHGLVVIYLTLIALYAGVPAFQALLNNIYGYIPSWGASNHPRGAWNPCILYKH